MQRRKGRSGETRKRKKKRQNFCVFGGGGKRPDGTRLTYEKGPAKAEKGKNAERKKDVIAKSSSAQGREKTQLKSALIQSITGKKGKKEGITHESIHGMPSSTQKK